MGLFGKKKILDLSEGYRSPARKIPAKSEKSDSGFLNDMANSSSDSSSTSDNLSWDNDAPATAGEYQNKKQKIAKRLLDMTDKIEDLSNQVYHLKQRIELLEKKLKVRYE